MKIFSIWLALSSADLISFNRLGNSVEKHVANISLLRNETKVKNIELKLQLLQFMVKHGNVEKAKNLLNQVQTEKRNQKSQNRLEKYLKH